VHIVVADSSDKEYTLPFQSNYIQYYHFPGIGLPQKLSAALRKIHTTFTVMCADDDFIIPEGIQTCAEFLKANKEYAAAQGNCVCYFKDTIHDTRVKFLPMYIDQLSFAIADNVVLKRVSDLFKRYRSIFCAVHYTKNLQLAYNENIAINNLFLNEYLSGIVPLSAGKYKELN